MVNRCRISAPKAGVEQITPCNNRKETFGSIYFKSRYRTSKVAGKYPIKMFDESAMSNALQHFSLFFLTPKNVRKSFVESNVPV